MSQYKCDGLVLDDSISKPIIKENKLLIPLEAFHKAIDSMLIEGSRDRTPIGLIGSDNIDHQ